MTAYSAIQHLKEVIADEAKLQAEIEKINAALSHHQAAINAISDAQSAATHGVSEATKRLSEALIAAGEGGEDDPLVAQARAGLQTAIKAKDRAEAKAAEAEAHKQAVMTLNERGRPIAERLMQIAQLKSDAAAKRLREYGDELAVEHRAAAQKLAELYSKGQALNRIALGAGLSESFAPSVGPTVILEGVGRPERVIVPIETDVPAHRTAFIQRLHAEGFNLIGA